MASKIMLEVTQMAVRGNEVLTAPGELFEVGAELPEGVQVREVIVDVPDAEPEQAPPVQQHEQPHVHAQAGAARAAGQAKG